MSQPFNIASPAATGGAGTTFEHQVGAVFLALLLTRGLPAVFKDCQVEEVGFQTQRLGWETDDLLVVCSSAQHGQRRLAIQVKRTLHIRASSTDCQETFQGFWKDFNDPDKFEPDHDALVIVTLRGTNTLLEGLGSLLDCARNSSDEADFTRRTATQGLSTRESRNCGSVIKSIIEEADSSAPNDKDFWRFLKAVHLLSLDLTTSTAQAESMTKQALAMACELSNPLEVVETTWLKLIEVASSAAMGGRTLQRQDLPEDLLSRHVAIDGPETRLQFFRDHTQLILDGIGSTIAGSVKIPRDELRQSASDALAEHQALVLTGPPGGGKSALAKSVILSNQCDHECLSFRGEDFAKSSIDDVLQARMTGLQLKTLLGAQERVLIHVESVERLLEHPVRDAFADLVRIAEECENVHLLLTCRDYAAAAAVSSFFNQGNLTPAVIAVPPLSDLDLNEVATSLPGLEVPFSNPRIKDLLRNPFLLDLAAKLDWLGEYDLPTDVIALRRRCWSELARRDGLTLAGMPDRRERTLIGIAEKRARELRAFVPTDGMDSQALDALYKDGVVSKDANGFAAPVHDVIEDWAVIHWMELLVARHQWQVAPIAATVGEHPAMRRGFREWLKEALEQDRDNADRFVLSAYADGAIAQHFRDDVLVSMLRSNSVKDFISRQKERLLVRDGELLTRVIHLLRVACRKIPDWLDGQHARFSLWFEPDGEAWPAVLDLVADSLHVLSPAHARLLTGLIEDWSRGVSTLVPLPIGAPAAGRIAFGLLDLLNERRDGGPRKEILEVIVKVPRCNGPGFEDLINRALIDADKQQPISRELSEILLTGLEGWPACRDYPELMAAFAMSRYCCTENIVLHDGFWMPPPLDVEDAFGLRRGSATRLYPGSAVQGPFLPLLRWHPEIGLQLVLNLCNRAAEWYGERKSVANHVEPPFKLTLSVAGRGDVQQWANDRLWMAYRGTSVVPYVLQCALMALEKWLLELCENGHPVEAWLERLLAESNSVMTTAVVASVCVACPTASGDAALTVLTARDVFSMDLRRKVNESSASVLLAFPEYDPMRKYYLSEREQSNALEHRNQDIELLASKLQFTHKREDVWDIIDAHRNSISTPADRSEEDREFLLALHRMDVRRWELSDPVSTVECTSQPAEPEQLVQYSVRLKDMDDDLQDFVDEGADAQQWLARSLQLVNWGITTWKRRGEACDGSAWKTAMDEAKKLQQLEVPATIFDDDAIGYVAALGIRDNWGDMMEEDREWCIDTVIREIHRESDSNDYIVHVSNNPMKADRPGAYVLPKMLALAPNDPIVLAATSSAMTHTSEQVALWCAEGAAHYLVPGDEGLLLRCAGAFAMSARLQVEQEYRERAIVLENWNRGKQATNGWDRLSRWVKNILPRPKQRPEDGDVPRVQGNSIAVREAFLRSSIDAEEEIRSLDLSTGPARLVVLPISSMLTSVPGSTLAKDFHRNMAQAVVESRTARCEDRSLDWQFDSNLTMVKQVCEFVLKIPCDAALFCCQPFLEIVASHPSEVEYFVEYLILQEDLATQSQTSFWEVWSELGDRAVDAKWSSDITSSTSKGMALTDKILLGVPWRSGVHHWNRLEGHEGEVGVLVGRLPPVPPILEAYARYLDGVGRGSLPAAFSSVADILRKGGPSRLLGNQNTVLHLESQLVRYVYGEPSRLKSDPTLRSAVLYILDQLVEGGSSAAFSMRDDFVTPLPSY